MDNSPSTAKRFVYFYFNRNEAEKIGQVVQAHVQYWKAAAPQGYMGGPFADHTGGLISFVATDLRAAEEIIQQDPFIVHDLVAEKWIKKWMVE